jgi:hypothetical protein
LLSKQKSDEACKEFIIGYILEVIPSSRKLKRECSSSDQKGSNYNRSIKKDQIKKELYNWIHKNPKTKEENYII